MREEELVVFVTQLLNVIAIHAASDSNSVLQTWD